MSADDSKGPVAVWFQWHVQQDNAEGESEAIQKFLTVQCQLDNNEAATSLSHLRLWIQVYQRDMCKHYQHGQLHSLTADE